MSRKSCPLTVQEERRAEKARRARQNERRRVKRQDPVYRAAENQKRARYRALKRLDPVYRAEDNAKNAARKRLQNQKRAAEKAKMQIKEELAIHGKQKQTNHMIEDSKLSIDIH